MTDPIIHTTTDPCIIDRDRLVSISEGDREFELELLDAYIDDACDCLGGIETALAAADWHNLGAVAHQLKGASGNIGAACMLELCARLEGEARNQCNDGTVEELYQALEAIKVLAQNW